MKRTSLVALALSACVLATCRPPAAQTPAATPAALATQAAAGAPEPASPTPQPPPPGQTIVVTSTADGGPGSLRQALLDAASGDTITFDPAVFPPAAPATITLTSGLPAIGQGYLTIDASDAGVILDGSQLGDDYIAGLEVTSSWNTIRGLHFAHFAPGIGIAVSSGAQHNTIGGDRATGSGPLGQGNLVTDGDQGIGLWGTGTSYNTVTGNLIGTDATGTQAWPNSGSGIWISEGASYNTIGPDNVVAFSGSSGIEILDADTVGNTLVRNSIHDNAHAGISLMGSGGRGGGNHEVAAPVIFDFDLEAGTAAGSTCANCTVEVYSDAGQEGAVYEGQAVADGAGSFSLTLGAPFTGPYLTATATDADGNTSPFSAPTEGARRVAAVQQGNSQPRTGLQPRRSLELADNRLGEMVYLNCASDSDEEAQSFFNRMDEMGFKWVRVSTDPYDWPEVELTGDYSTYEISPCQLGAIDAFNANGVSVYYTLVFWDPAITTYPGYTRFRTQDEIDRFLDYIRFTIENVKGKVDWYALLNESNCTGDDQRHVLVDDYISVARQVIPVIRELDPQAGIVVGDVTPLNETGSYDYLMRILNSDLMPQVDGITWHGSSGLSLEYQPDFYNQYPTWVDQIIETARSNGFQGQFFTTELHWRTPDTPQPIHGQPWFYTDMVAAKYYARGIVYHLGKGLIAGVGHEGYEGIPPIRQAVRGLATVMAGAVPAEVDVTIEGPVTDVRQAAFSLPDGSTLLALWRDGIAVDDDPGVPATLTITGAAAQAAAGIDVLAGFEQPLMTEAAGSDLVIPGLLIKDYPVLIRLH